MRTVIFFGLLAIADAIGTHTGWHLTDKTLAWAVWAAFMVMLFAIVADIVDLVRNYD